MLELFTPEVTKDRVWSGHIRSGRKTLYSERISLWLIPSDCIASPQDMFCILGFISVLSDKDQFRLAGRSLAIQGKG